MEAFLESKRIDNPTLKWEKELKEISGRNFLTSYLRSAPVSKAVADFGLDLIGESKRYFELFDYASAAEIIPQLKDAIWEDKAYYDLLVFFFGEESAPYIKYAWNLMPNMMYQHGYYRRSFRAPKHRYYPVLNQLNLLRSSLFYPHRYHFEGNIYYDLTIGEQIIFSNEVSFGPYQFLIWSAAIDLNNTKIIQLIEDIVYDKHPTGKVSGQIIKALLNSNKMECWQLVEKLLLSAQRQEGLRQTILEALDETSIGALEFMIDVIIREKLSRFSSVVRAIGTWTGLGWEAEKEKTVRDVITYAQHFFAQPDLIKDGVKSPNNNEVYMALWVQGVLDVEATVPYLHELYDKGSVEKKCLALRFAGETGDPYIQMPLYYKTLRQDNLQILACSLEGLKPLLQANVKSRYYIDNSEFPDLFDNILALTQAISVKEKAFTGKIFSWLNFKFKKDDLFFCLLYLMGNDDKKLNALLLNFEKLNIEVRTAVAREVLGDLFVYSWWSSAKETKNLTVSEYQREFALRAIKDRGESMVASAINVFSRVNLNTDEISVLHEMLKRKNAELRKSILSMVLKQDREVVLSFANQLAEKGAIEQRVASLDLLLQLQNQNKIDKKEVADWLIKYRSMGAPSEREEQLLIQLEPQTKRELPAAENGYGLYNPLEISPYLLPELPANSFFVDATQSNPYGFSQTIPHTKEALENLVQTFRTNENYEYERENWDNSKTTVLLGNEFGAMKRNTEQLTDLERFQNYPLSETWDKWFIDSRLQPVDLFLLTFAGRIGHEPWFKLMSNFVFYNEQFLPNPNTDRYSYYWNNPILKILQVLRLKYHFHQKNDFLIDATIKLFRSFSSEVLSFRMKINTNSYNYRSDEHGDGWQSQADLNVFLQGIDYENLNEEQVHRLWNIYRWRQFNGLSENSRLSLPPLVLYLKAFEQGLISEGEVYEGIIEPQRIHSLTGEGKRHRSADEVNLISKFPFLQPMIDRIRETFLDIEVRRGDTSTPVTQFVQQFQRIYGVNRFVELLTRLGKTNLYKGYISSWGGDSLDKQKLFSYLIKNCFPRKTDTQSLFDEQVKAHKIPDIRLVQAAVYAPQWQDFISNYLGWNGLDAAIWWMHAHTKTTAYQSHNAEFESEVAKHSSLDLQEFQDGAVDKTWFQKAYKQLGKAKWEMLCDSAKYVSDGNGHRRARLYADTLTGALKITAVTAKVKDKRDQDYLRVYGLVPLSKVNPEKDVLTRYEYIQQFKKESREFGSMKQSSEAVAIRIALENLARNAGYPDPIRLTWAMETKQVQQILSKETQFEIEDCTIGLIIDKEGKAELEVYKGDKKLKSIPTKLKKNSLVTELTKNRKVLREQWNRSRRGLEEAMTRGDEFTFSEIKNLFEHPVISKHLEKLVFVSDADQSGFYSKGNLVSAHGELSPINEDQTLRIAHCTDLHALEIWPEYQHYCFDKELKQPFKQIFRELYLPTPDELQEKAISRRYAGHQVQPKQTLALLKSRGWKVDYEEGLQKVFHKQGIQVKLYALADWFSPADVESPTLETVEFHSLKDYKNIPFEDISPRLFSEVMRDIDLVVSVAHVGGVDPEASHSSIEMRAVLIKESLRLFKLSNVEISGSHALIKGALADYSIHLGSAVVHQTPGKYLSILPVHSQHRGRLFLPFADDDPKSAEVISKVLLMAKDKDIQDPTILSQIDRKLGLDT